jgi:peptide/nickel transport system ATP-binding protein
VGESGSGKTTIGRALVRLAQESGGSIRFEGREVTAFDGRALAAYRLQTQMVFQDPFSSLDPRMTLEEIVAEGLRTLPGLPRAERTSRARAMLVEVGLPGDYADRYPHELSGGQRQRVPSHAAIVATPKLLVADEPVSALDVTVQKQILTLFTALQKKFGSPTSSSPTTWAWSSRSPTAWR